MILRALALLLAAPLCGQSGPVLSEIMADNNVTVLDADGDPSDYIEIHNPTAAAVDLGGWFLSDSAANRRKWAFPSPTILSSQGFLLVFASDKNRAVAGQELHTNFKLSSDGEFVGLADATGAPVHDLGVYPPQYPDMSYGLEFRPVVTSTKAYFAAGSPRQPNGFGAAVVGAVTYGPRPLTASTDCVITARLHNPNQATVNFVQLSYRVNYGTESSTPMRDDGVAPDLTANDDLWTASVPANRYTPGDALRWRVVSSVQNGSIGMAPAYRSASQSPQYFGALVEDPNSQTSIPTFHWWVQDPSRADTSTGTRCSVAYLGDYYDNVFVRIRGSSSIGYPKQSYKFDFNRGFKFRFDPSLGRVEEINLNTTFADKAYLRQILAYETFRDSGGQYSETRAVRQQQNGRFFMVSILTEQVDDDYLDRQGLDDKGALYKVYNTLAYYRSSELQPKITTPDGTSDIRHLIQQINTPGPTRDKFLWDQIDLPAVLNYWAGIVLMHDNDCVHKNYYLYRETFGDGEWRFLPWDKDLVFGRNYDNRTVLNDAIWAERDPQSHPLYGDSSHRKIDNVYNRLIHVLLAQPQIREMYLRRLRTLMDTLLNPSSTPVAQRYFEQRIDALERAMTPAVNLDRNRWGVPGYGDRTMDMARAVSILKNDYLARRRRHLFTTHSSSASGIIPDRQASFGFRLGFGRIEPNPVSNNPAEQFVEVVNSDTTAIDLSGWRLRGAGIEFEFPPGTVVAAGRSIFVTADSKAFRARAVSPRGGEYRLVTGPFLGRLISHLGLVVYDQAGNPVTETGEFPYSITTGGQGDAQILVTGARPQNHLWILFSGDNSGVPGSGPFLGLGNDVLWQVSLPLGTQPVHVLTDPAGSYSWSAPAQTVTRGVQLTTRAAYLDFQNRIVVSQVRRITF